MFLHTQQRNGNLSHWHCLSWNSIWKPLFCFIKIFAQTHLFYMHTFKSVTRILKLNRTRLSSHRGFFPSPPFIEKQKTSSVWQLDHVLSLLQSLFKLIDEATGTGKEKKRGEHRKQQDIQNTSIYIGNGRRNYPKITWDKYVRFDLRHLIVMHVVGGWRGGDATTPPSPKGQVGLGPG